MINVCVPVLRRYDLLHNLLLSLRESTKQPDCVYVIDNGNNSKKMDEAVYEVNLSCDVVVWPAEKPLGVAEAWNWFITSVPEDRVIANDDITFAPDSLARLTAPNADLIWGCGFSCFVMRSPCVKKVGLFDEEISPGYAYYEDDDYLQRLDGRGTKQPLAWAVNVDAGLTHHSSATLKAASHVEAIEHHRRFKIAQSNYMRKWGITPEEMFAPPKAVGLLV